MQDEGDDDDDEYDGNKHRVGPEIFAKPREGWVEDMAESRKQPNARGRENPGEESGDSLSEEAQSSADPEWAVVVTNEPHSLQHPAAKRDLAAASAAGAAMRDQTRGRLQNADGALGRGASRQRHKPPKEDRNEQSSGNDPKQMEFSSHEWQLPGSLE